MNVLSNVNLNKNELQNAVMQPLAAAPSNPVEGQYYYNTVDKMAYQYKGSSLGWKPVGEENTIEGIKVNGTDVTPANKVVDITVPVAGDVTPSEDGTAAVGTSTAFARADHVHPHDSSKLDKAGGTMSGAIAMGGNKITGLADGTANQDAVTVAQLNAARVGSLRPSGSIAFASLPSLGSSEVNKIFNITNSFVTTADFVEGAGVNYPAGTNVAIINIGTDANPIYKYDAYTGTIDTSAFLTKTGLATETGSATDNAMTQKAVTDAINGLIKKATGTISTSSTSAIVNYTGTLISAYATMGGDIANLDITVASGSVTFTTSVAPSAEVSCTVIYA